MAEGAAEVMHEHDRAVRARSGGASRQSRSASPRPTAAAEIGFNGSRERSCVAQGMRYDDRVQAALEPGAAQRDAAENASACATDGGPASTATPFSLPRESLQQASAGTARQHVQQRPSDR